MYIVPSLLEKYCTKVGYDIHIEVDLINPEVIFRFVSGKYEMNSSLAVPISGQDISDILELNGILGESGKVKKILESEQLDQNNKIDSLIYTTLAKYVIQMLNQQVAKIYSLILKLWRSIRKLILEDKELQRF